MNRERNIVIGDRNTYEQKRNRWTGGKISTNGGETDVDRG